MDKQLMGLIVATNNQAAMKFASLLDVPFRQVQKLMLSKQWREEHKKLIAEHLEKLHKESKKGDSK